MPSLMEAYKISSRVAHVGFDWPNIEGLFDKLDEETGELRQNLEEYPEPGPQPESAAGVAGARGVEDPAGVALAAGRRSRRSVLCAGEHRALSFARSRVGTAQDEPQVSPPLPVPGRAGCAKREASQPKLRWRRWSPCGRRPSSRKKRERRHPAAQSATEVEEFRACVALQKEVWGFADNELVPLRIFSLAPKIGGQVIGAWDGDDLVGFAFSIPGTRNGHAYLHSHMLAVPPNIATADWAAG